MALRAYRACGLVLTAIAFFFSHGPATSAAEDEGDPVTERVAGSPYASTAPGGHPFREIVFSPDGKLFATTTGLQTTRSFSVWETDTLKRRFTKDVKQAARTLHFSPDGKTLTVGVYSGKLTTLDTTTGTSTGRDFSGAKTTDRMAVSPDGSMFATSNRKDFSITIWNTATLKAKMTLKGHTRTVGFFVFSPDGKKLLSGGQDIGTSYWDVAKGQLIRTFDTGQQATGSLTFSRDGKIAGVACYDGFVRLFDADSGALLAKLTVAEQGQGFGVPERLAISPDKKLVAFAGSAPAIAIFQLEKPAAAADDERRVATLVAQLDDDNFKLRQEASRELAKLGDRIEPLLTKSLAEASSIEVRRRLSSLVASVKAPKPYRLLVGHKQKVDTLVFSPDGKRLFSGSHDAVLRVWDFEASKSLAKASIDEENGSSNVNEDGQEGGTVDFSLIEPPAEESFPVLPGAPF